MESSDQPDVSANGSEASNTLPNELSGKHNTSVSSPLPANSTAPIMTASNWSSPGIALGTPGVDMSMLMLPAGRPSSFRACVLMMGTPSAVGAFPVLKTVAGRAFIGGVATPGPVQAFVTCTPLATHESLVDMDVEASILGKQFKPDVEPSDPPDVECDEYQAQNAMLLLDVARAKSTVRCCKMELAQAQLDKSAALGRLYKCHINEMKRMFNVAESHLGSVHNSIRTNGGILCQFTLPKWHRQDSPSSRFDSNSGMCHHLCS
ncbi:hypothetical protein JVU11DRAFT_13041 [Chiua virens]|nr:hypothetical protein JVU11DRAFT_13041 [Chiua virens]